MKFIYHTAVIAILAALPVARVAGSAIDADKKGDAERNKKSFSLKKLKSSKYGGTDFVDCNKELGRAEKKNSKIDVSNCLVLKRWGASNPGAQEMCLGMGGVFMRAGKQAKSASISKMPNIYCCFGKEMDDMYTTVCSEGSLCGGITGSHRPSADLNIRVPPVVEDGVQAVATWYQCPLEILEKYEDLSVETVTF